MTHPLVTPEALAEIYAHAARDYPNECCGIIFGPRDQPQADRVRPCINTQNDLHAADPEQNPRDASNAYNLGAPDLFALQKSLRTDTPAKIIYHSHVDVGAYFSPTDQAAAVMDGEPTYPVEYIVVDAQSDGARTAAQFAWDEASKQYVEVRRY
jgi:proteasome lid subunit RPN8/RPN11